MSQYLREESTSVALIQLVRGGEMTPGEAVGYFRQEFHCSLQYVIAIGLWQAIQKADAQRALDESAA
jgi:hypothetical protein